MKLILFTAGLLLGTQYISAQNNRVELDLGRFYFPGVKSYNQPVVRQIGIAYSRSLKNKLELRIGYTMSPFSFLDFTFDDPSFFRKQRIMTWDRQDSEANIGKVIRRHNGHIFDIGGKYPLYRFKKHTLGAELGLSLIQVQNTYLKDMLRIDPWEVRTVYEDKIEWYFGVSGGLTYSYSFAKDKFDAGAYLRARPYSRDFPFQLNYGIQIGYRF